jgi:ABC-2 type transport system ATP-binding protein
VIEIKELTKKFRKKTVLDKVSLRLESGVYGMLGPNGAGKTTLIRCLLALYPINGGEIQMGIPPYRIGYLPQNFELFRELTVYDMLSYFCGLKKISKGQREEVIEKSLKFVNLLEYKKSKISKLSGGMQRRVGIAQAIMGEPPIIIFDEPTVGLDPEERRRFKDMLFELKKDRTILFSTHIVSDLEEVCDKVIIMNHGKVVQTGTLHDLCEKDEVSRSLEEIYLTVISESRG